MDDMKKRWQYILPLCMLGITLLGLSVWAAMKPDGDSSLTERRKLTSFPNITLNRVWEGQWATEFETYAMDQFPLRDGFRSLKALAAKYLMGQQDSHGVYVVEGSAAKLDYPLGEDSLAYAAGRFQWVYAQYLQDTESKVYLSIIPDKNFFLGANNGYPTLAYDELVESMGAKMDFVQYIDLFPLLKATDYYATDAHWRQECLVPVAQKLGDAMGATVAEEGEYEAVTLDSLFCGVYVGQSVLPMEGEDMIYLTSQVLEAATVYDYETDSYIPVYDVEKGAGRDPYEMFLGGSKSLLYMENNCAATDRELIVFRDSFGSSIAPLLLSGYKSITLIDIRYISPSALGRFVDFHGQDVLFLYSTSVLNNSETIK